MTTRRGCVIERISLLLLAAAVFLLGAASARADLSDQDRMFDPECVSHVDITAPSSSIANLYADPKGAYQPMTAMTVDLCGTTPKHFGPYNSATFRLKGSGSFRSLDGKAAFKIKLASGSRIGDLKSLTLNNMVQDWSSVHEVLAFDAYRAVGVQAPRVGYATITVNGVDYGLHANVESLDDRFAGAHFSSLKHLYEAPDWQAGFMTFASRDILPASVANFQVQEGSKTDVSDLTALAANIALADDDAWWTAFQQSFDIGSVMKFWAAGFYLGDRDDYVAYVNNYYLHSTTGGVFGFLPWGTDKSFTDEDMPLDPSTSNSPVVARCLNHPPCRTAYRTALGDVAETIIGLDLVSKARHLHEALANAIAADPRKEMTMHENCEAVAATIEFLIDREEQWASDFRSPLSGIRSAQSNTPLNCSSDLPADETPVTTPATQLLPQPVVGSAAHSDVDGDGRSDTIEIVAVTDGSGRSTLRVTLASGAVLSAPVGQGLPPAPTVRRVKNIDGRVGTEIFVDGEHTSTNDTIYVFTYKSGNLHLAGKLPAFGGDAGIKFGFTCHTAGGKHRITAHRFLRGPNGKWRRRNLVYRWASGSLARESRASYAKIERSPPASQTKIAC